MEEELGRFAEFLRNSRHMAENTLVSYRRDLRQLAEWLSAEGIEVPDQVTDTLLRTYVLWLGKQGRATTTVSRVVASTKAFFAYEKAAGRIAEDPAARLHAPRVEKKAPTVLTGTEVRRLLKETEGEGAKKLRDRAMLELLCATGLRVSEIILLSIFDVDFPGCSVTCTRGGRMRNITFGKETEGALRRYLDEARPLLLKESDSGVLFLNISGQPMSRQGFWKIIRYYGAKAGIRGSITPQILRNSFAARLVEGGADVRSLQEAPGFADSSVTHAFAGRLGAGEETGGQHPGGAGSAAGRNPESSGSVRRRDTERRRASRNGI